MSVHFHVAHQLLRIYGDIQSARLYNLVYGTLPIPPMQTKICTRRCALASNWEAEEAEEAHRWDTIS
jgi:hypothetical protein